MIVTLWFTAASLFFWDGTAQVFATPKWLVFALLLVYLAIRHGPGPSRPGPVPCLLLAWPLVGALWSQNPHDFLMALLPWSVLIVAFVALPLSESAHRGLRRGLALAAFLAAGYLLLQFAGLDPIYREFGTAPGSFFGNPSHTAHFLLLALCLGDWGERRLRLPAQMLVLWALVFAGSRAAWLGTLVWLLFTFSSSFAWRRRALLILALSGLVAGAWLLRSEARQALTYLGDPAQYVAAYSKQPRLIAERDPWFRGKRLSLMTRVILAANSLAMVRDHGLPGVGIGQYHTTYPAYARALFADINMSQDYRARSTHNLLLDSTIMLGLPWCLLAGWWLFAQRHRWNGDANYILALTLQAGIALVALNFYNPAILVPLILLARPPVPPAGNKSVQRSHPMRLATVLFLLPVGFLFWLDMRAAGPPKPGTWLEAYLFPERLAAFWYAEEALPRAWRFQQQALRQDPHGPETLHNLALIAAELSRRGQADFEELALRSLAVNRARHPFYLPSARLLEQMTANSKLTGVNSPASETLWRGCLDRLAKSGREISTEKP
jgi:hypothetical protein